MATVLTLNATRLRGEANDHACGKSMAGGGVMKLDELFIRGGLNV